MKASEKVRQLLALARSTPIAPERESAVRLIRWCQQTVTQQRFPGPLPAYCSDGCKAEARREQMRERVRRRHARQRR